MNEIPTRALSIMQPWAWLIVNGYKAIENRDWPTKFRGPIAIHAGKKVDATTEISLRRGYHPVTQDRIKEVHATWDRGGIVGVAEIVDCIDASDDPWFVGRYGFVIANARPIELIPVKGALGFFDWRRNL